MENIKIKKSALLKCVSECMRSTGYGRGYRYEACVFQNKKDYVAACATGGEGTAPWAPWRDMKSEVEAGGVVVIWVYHSFNEGDPIADVVTLALPTFVGEAAQVLHKLT